MTFLYVLLAIIILLIMIVIHEFGHYIAGKIFKFKINEFSVGFGPKIFSKTNKQTGEKFSLRAIPLGGYCAFEDESGEEGEENPKSFVKEAPWKRLIVLAAGGVFNILSAFIFSFLFLLIVGLPVSTPTVSEVVKNPDTGVYYNQLMVGDKIIAVDDIAINEDNSYDEVMSKTGDAVKFSVLRNGENVTIIAYKQEIIYLQADGSRVIQTGKIGFTASYEYAGSFSLAIRKFVPYTFELSWAVIKSLFMMFTGQIQIKEMTGTVGTVVFMADIAQMNWRNIFLLLPLLASNLGIFNLLPIPALDGSKIVFTTIEWIRGKPINRNVENYIHTIGLFLLLLFVVVVDVLHFVL